MIGCCQLFFSSNKIPRLFDHQFLWKGSMDIWVFYIRLYDFLSTISLEGMNWYLRFLAWSYASREGSMWDYHFWSSEVKCASGSIGLKDSLIIKISGWMNGYLRLTIVILSFFFFIFLHLFIKLSGCPFSELFSRE